MCLSADFIDDDGKLAFPDLGLALLDNVPGLSYSFVAPPYKPEYTPDQLRDCDVLISLKPRVTAQSLEGIHTLCAIGRCGVGYDNVDLAACTSKDIAVFITPRAVVRPVAESIVLLVLALSHNLVLKDRMVRRGLWKESTTHFGREPRQRIIGTIGLGNIGSAAIQLLRNFDVSEFLAFDPYVSSAAAAQSGVRLVSLEDLLRQSDYVLVNCPLTPETGGLIGQSELNLMKKDAVLINTARGPIVREAALVEALQSGKLRAAALDVFEQEPLASGSPLTKMDNVIVTSHSIAWTEELFRDMGSEDCRGALAVHRGEAPDAVVNREVLSRPGFQEKLRRYKTMHGGLAK